MFSQRSFENIFSIKFLELLLEVFSLNIVYDFYINIFIIQAPKIVLNQIEIKKNLNFF